MRVLLTLSVALSAISLSPANAVALNSQCNEAQWLAGAKVKIGKTSAQCVAGPDTYYWIDVKQVSAAAANEGPLEKLRRSRVTSSTVVQVAIVPDVVGLPASSAMLILQRLGLNGVRIYRSQGGQAGAECAMTNSGVVMGQSPNPGTQVRLHSPVQYVTSC